VLGRLNADDQYCAGAVAAVLNVLDAHPQVDALCGDAEYIDADDRPIRPYETEPWDPARLECVCYLCQPAVFMRRRLELSLRGKHLTGHTPASAVMRRGWGREGGPC
jgi:hypothetical protein